MSQPITLYRKYTKVNLNKTPRKSIIENLISYSKSIQFSDTPIGKILFVNN
jgi:hypothetical protein